MLSISGQSPAEGSSNIALDEEIEFTIVDDGTGIDTTSLVVNVNGYRAITGIEFQSGYAGDNSEITFSGDDLSILIDPESNFEKSQVITLQIQIKNLIGNFYNFTYSFKILLEEPILV